MICVWSVSFDSTPILIYFVTITQLRGTHFLVFQTLREVLGLHTVPLLLAMDEDWPTLLFGS